MLIPFPLGGDQALQFVGIVIHFLAKGNYYDLTKTLLKLSFKNPLITFIAGADHIQDPLVIFELEIEISRVLIVF